MDTITPGNAAGTPIEQLMVDLARPRVLPKPCHPMYIAARIKGGLLVPDATLSDGQIITEVGEIETIGDCRYAMTVTDYNGRTHRVTIEVMK